MNYNIYALNNKTLFDICVVVPSRAYLYGVKSKKKKKKKLFSIVYQHVHVTEHATERSKAAKALKTCRNYSNIRVETK